LFFLTRNADGHAAECDSFVSLVAPPAYISLTRFASMGYWRAADLELLKEISPFIKDARGTERQAIVEVMKHRFKDALSKQRVS